MCVSRSVAETGGFGEDIQKQSSFISLVNMLSRLRNRSVYTAITSECSRLAFCFGGLGAVLRFPDSNNIREDTFFRRHSWAAHEANKQEAEQENNSGDLL